MTPPGIHIALRINSRIVCLALEAFCVLPSADLVPAQVPHPIDIVLLTCAQHSFFPMPFTC